MENNLSKSILAATASSLTDISKDVLEATFDSVLDEGLIKDIPVLNTVHSLFKIGSSIKEKIFINMLLKFLFELKDIAIDKRIDFVNKLQDGEYRDKAGEKIIVILDKLDDSDKASMVGVIFRACVQGKLKFVDFLRLSHIINVAFLDDLYLLKNGFYADGHSATYHLQDTDLSKLYRIGLASASIMPDKLSIAIRERYRGVDKLIDYKTEYKLNNDAYIITREIFDYAWIEKVYGIYK
ncbi:hypothetical protein ACFPAF_09305 [Hymenobacter endophyticus]|uniref:DUF1819 family protein n=1 Tax=Hymenobacter endophyticus TaxID=3076335 RepID=A0ABU3TGT7_9BACT|nr:hypothetical protein [Hymenobacter endophyticus]MDU0370586.1 hypothetical protein [Hymenobacter endophyticus]